MDVLWSIGVVAYWLMKMFIIFVLPVVMILLVWVAMTDVWSGGGKRDRTKGETGHDPGGD